MGFVWISFMPPTGLLCQIIHAKEAARVKHRLCFSEICIDFSSQMRSVCSPEKAKQEAVDYIIINCLFFHVLNELNFMHLRAKPC